MVDFDINFRNETLRNEYEFEEFEIPGPHAISPSKAAHELDRPIIANFCIFLAKALYLPCPLGLGTYLRNGGF